MPDSSAAFPFQYHPHQETNDEDLDCHVARRVCGIHRLRCRRLRGQGRREEAGGRRARFLKKCEGDAKAGEAGAACEEAAKEKKLAGAAKSSFVKKCVADAQAAR